MAELASAFPSSGGPYYYAYMVSTEKYRALVAYVVGWLSVLAWLFAFCSICTYTAQIILALASFYHPLYIATQWQVWIVYTGIIIICTLIACLLPRLVPLLNSLVFWVSILGFLTSVITLLAVSGAKQSGSVVFTEWINQTGWDDGLAFLLAVGQCMFCFMCLDAAAHLSEQLQNPSRDIPRAMSASVLIGFATIVPYSLAMLFSIIDFAPIIATSLPILEVYHQALDSRGGAMFFAVVILVICFGGCIAGILGISYLIRAFARDNGVPFSRVFSKIQPGLQVPLNATLLTAIFSILYGLLYIGSTEAFNSFISTSVLTLYTAYVVPQGIVLWRGRDRVLPEHWFNLGRIFGPFCNIFSCLWMCLYTVIFCFPIYLPVTVKSMNYVSVVYVGSLVFIAVMWILHGKRGFTGPQIDDFGPEMSTGAANSADQSDNNSNKSAQ
ncbi:hypothetical protein Plec18167_009494 [Paecilomyces lecythidis]|uniref:Uncharacterized protein n=1 Tax=Paecilomyces lecythidis TaxID=3004212 RepID=A0ABR3WNY8_9EURO